MVSSVPNPFSRFQQLFLLVATLCIATSHASEDDISRICSGTPNVALCHELVESIPGAARLDFETLGKLFIKDTLANVTGTMNLIESLLKKTTNPQVKKNLSFCSGSLANTVNYFSDAQNDFINFHYFNASSDIANGSDYVDNCNKAIGSSVPALSPNIQILALDGFILTYICGALE